MTQFAVTEAATGRILRGKGRPDSPGFSGVPDLRPMPNAGLVFHPWQGRIEFSARPTPTSTLHWVDGAPHWVDTATIEQARASKVEAMRQACEAHIFAGFMCSALGEPFLYPANDRDQKNLVGSVTDSLLAGGDPDWRTPFWCCDAAGVWEFRMHTIAEIQQVGREGKAAIIAALSKNELLARQIAVASAEQLPGIAW